MAKKNQKAPVAEEQIALDVQLNKSEKFIEENWKKLGLGLLAIIVLVSAFFIYRHMAANKEIDAQKAIAAAQTAFAQQQYEQALNGDGAQAAGFLKVMKDYSGTKTANLAKLYAAICYANTDKVDDAIKMYEDFSQKDDQMVSPTSIAALANCYVKKGNNDKGVELLIKAAKAANNDAVSPVFLFQAGQIYEADGKADKALELYKQIKKDYVQSAVNQDIDKYIERATK